MESKAVFFRCSDQCLQIWPTQIEAQNVRIQDGWTFLMVSQMFLMCIPTLPETNIAHENLIFPGKYHQNGGFSMAMLVLGRVSLLFGEDFPVWHSYFLDAMKNQHLEA